jgi:protein-disulfide isomerase
VGVVLCCALSAPAVVAQGHEAKANATVAIVQGQPVYEDELTTAAQGQLMPLRQQEYEVKKGVLDNIIQQKLLDDAAKKKGLTAEQFLAQEVDAKVPEPSEAEMQGYYLAVRDKTKSTFAELQPQLKQAVKQGLVQQARQDYLKKLRQDAAVVVELDAPRVNVSPDPARVRGNANAPVTIVEFSDYQCPYCRQAEPTIAAVVAKYGDKVRLAYRDFPLRAIHEHAEMAAEASRCAEEQGKFWEYHDQLFKNPNLDKEALVGYARSSSMDADKFEACLKSEKYKAEIDKDLEDGRKAGVTGTPSFFINGIPTSGAQQQDTFTRMIEDELAKKGSLQAAKR